MKRLVLAVAVLMLAALALVAFPPSPKVKEAALAPIALEAAPLATPQARAAAPIASPPADATLAAGDASDSDCEAALKAMGVTFEVEAPVTGETGCGTERPLKVSSVGVELKPAVTTRCPVAKALAAWTKDVVIPSAKLYMKDEPTALSTGDSYQCRTRRGDGETKISEHARANAVDITGVAFSGGRTLAISEQPGDDGARSFQAAIRGGACAYFPTVLGPGANAAHADHLHVDLIDRGNGYRICE